MQFKGAYREKTGETRVENISKAMIVEFFSDLMKLIDPYILKILTSIIRKEFTP